MNEHLATTVVALIVSGELRGRSDFAIRGGIEYVLGIPVPPEALETIRRTPYYQRVRAELALREAAAAVATELGDPS